MLRFFCCKELFTVKRGSDSSWIRYGGECESLSSEHLYRQTSQTTSYSVRLLSGFPQTVKQEGFFFFGKTGKQLNQSML